MGRFLNPDSSAFQVALNSEIYVDKTGLLEYTNRVLDTNQALICNSRPRRFGKSITANMLTAYYSKGCDSEQMFAERIIGSSKFFRHHLNQYDVIHFDVQWCLSPAKSVNTVVSYIETNIIQELENAFPDIDLQSAESLAEALSYINSTTGRKFIIIIDEWDVLIRDEAANISIQEEYINFLRGLFKGTEPTKFLHLAYLTGILPIKKLKTQSALNNFDEFTMLNASILAPYVGFTKEEVRVLCKKYNRDFEETVHWYDGYLLSECHIYNPKAVVSALIRGDFQSYWSQTGTYESILPLINMDFDGLKAAVLEMIAGEAVKVKTISYQNDMLTLLIHLGYFAYDEKNKTAFVPNEEIRSELIDAVEDTQWNEFEELRYQSDELLRATLDRDCAAVAETIEEIHSGYASAIAYNNENSLSSVLSIAYLGAMRYYFKPIRELPTGRGFADLVFLPKREYPDIPALIVELKWNQSAETAIQQINYSKKSKEHTCIIEKFNK